MTSTVEDRRPWPTQGPPLRVELFHKSFRGDEPVTVDHQLLDLVPIRHGGVIEPAGDPAVVSHVWRSEVAIGEGAHHHLLPAWLGLHPDTRAVILAAAWHGEVLLADLESRRAECF